MIKNRITISLLILVVVAGQVVADDVHPTDVWTAFGSTNTTVNGALAPIGTLIDAYDGTGVHCGTQVVDEVPGKFRFMSVYGDDVRTPDLDEGCVYGEVVNFKVNGRVATKLGPDSDLWASGDAREMDLAITQAFGLNITGPDNGAGQPGQTVSYNITVENTGDGIDLVDVGAVSQHGWSIVDPPDPQYINPGENGIFVVKVAVPSAATAGTKDTLTVTATSTLDPSTSATHQVSTLVGEMTGFDLRGQTSGSGEPGDTVDYSILIENTGNTTEPVGVAMTSSNGWTIVNPPEASYDLTPFGSVEPEFGLEIPEDAMVGDKDTLTVIVTSLSKADDADTLQIITTVVINYGFAISGPASGVGNPGQSVEYTPVTIENTGSLSDQAEFEWTSSHGWTVLGPTDPSSVVSPGGTLDYIFTVQIPGGAVVGTKDTLTIVVNSLAEPTKKDTLRIVTLVGKTYGVQLSGPVFGIGHAGESVDYEVTIYNSGNTNDSISTAVTSFSGWNLSGLPDPKLKLKPTSGEIFLISADVPGDAAAGDKDTIRVVAKSLSASDKADTLMIVTLVEEYTGVDDADLVLPESFELLQNYPNPFNMETVIPFQLAKPGEVTLDIYDILGRRVSRINAGYLPGGTHELHWNGVDDNRIDVASGIYFYRLTAGEQSLTRKMVLLK